MSLIKHSMVIAYSAAQMYALVNAVEAYPQFLPWCKSAQVKHCSDNMLLATLEIAKGGLYKTFTTRNIMTPDEQIVIDLVEGPFAHLSGRWEFNAVDPLSCQIDFSLSFSFNNKVTELILRPVLHYMADTMIAAFSKRAREVYPEH